MTIRKIIEQAIIDAEIDAEYHVSPAVQEAERICDELLKAAGWYDKFDAVFVFDIADGFFSIITLDKYELEDRSQYDFPESILDAEDHIKEAKIYGIDKRIDDIKGSMEAFLREIKRNWEYLRNAEIVLQELQRDLDSLK